MKYYTAEELETILNISSSGIRKRATRHNYPYIMKGNQKAYNFDVFDDQTKQKIIQFNTKSLKNLKLNEVTNNNLREMDCHADGLQRQRINDNDLNVGKIRAFILRECSRFKTPKDFCFVYNANKITIPQWVKERYPIIAERTIYSWREKSVDCDPIELSPHYNRESKPGSETLTDEQIALIQSIYVAKKDFKMAKTHRYITENFPDIKATYSTFKRIINSLPKAWVDYYKKGKKHNNDKYTPAIERDYTKIGVMEQWDSDHHQFDIFVKDENGRVYRPWLTCFQDMRSRKIVGWHIGRIPSSFSIALAFRKAIIPNGSPYSLIIDNGKDYKGKHLQGYNVKLSNGEVANIEGVFQKFGVKCIFATPYHGQSKPIERFFGTMINDFAVNYKEYSKSNTVSTIVERNRTWEEIKKDIDLTLERLISDFDEWVTKWNATHHHRGQGMNGRTPDEVFESGIKKYVKIDIDDVSLDSLFTRDVVRTIQKNGISINGANYYSPKLYEYRGRGQVIVRINPFDMEKIEVLKLNGDFICEAVAGIYADTGITEENMKNVNRQKKNERKIKEMYDASIIDKAKSYVERVIEDKEKSEPRKNRDVIINRKKKNGELTNRGVKSNGRKTLFK